jgi:hypothetical protein
MGKNMYTEIPRSTTLCCPVSTMAEVRLYPNILPFWVQIFTSQDLEDDVRVEEID